MALMLVGPRRWSVLWLAATIVILAFVAYEATLQWDLVAGRGLLGDDFRFYRYVGEHWLSTGELYRPEQLAGPYASQVNVDVLYPPLALLLFVPFTVLPAVIWWAVPLGLLVVAMIRLRPLAWTWPILALIAFWPRTMGGILYGNSDMWIAGFIAAGTIWAWPAALALMKPTFAPLALVGVRSRWWWVAAGSLALLSLAMLPLWADYVSAIRNVQGLPLDYSLANMPIALAPIIAWLGRRPGSVARQEGGRSESRR